MNILFLTENIIIPTIGGIERVSYSLVQGLKNKGYNIFSAYIKDINYDVFINKDLFIKNFRWNTNEALLRDFIYENKIEVIISQRQLGLEKTIREAINKSKINCSLFSVLHCRPGYEITDKEFIKFCYSTSKGVKKIKQAIKLAVYPLFRGYLQYTCRKKMMIAWKNSDKFILLSDNFKELFYQVYNIKKDNNKLTAINNPNSFEEYLEEEKIKNKDKTVIVVCRLEERSKRVSIILKIWKDIQGIRPKDWKLQIIGTGPEENIYKDMIKSQNITDIEMVGYSNPLKYYKKASLITMTSANEGFPMVLIESMQMGVVPIVMKSFESLADIIDNDVNGFIVPNNDIDAFTDKLLYLMNNPIILNNMAKESISKSYNFSIDNIIDKWDKLITTNNYEQ